MRAEELLLPAEIGAARLALELAGELSDAAARDDAEALHDVRVAARRLRTLIRAHRPPVGGKVRRRLRELARATSAARDAEALIERVVSFDDPAAAWLRERLEARRKDLGDLRPSVDDVVDRMRRRLDTVEASVKGRSFTEASLELTRAAAADLRWWLAQVRGEGDSAEAHQARIAGKRLRYLLEPLRAGFEEARTLVEGLKTLQDDLGELHDLHVLAGEIGAARAEPTSPPLDGLAAAVEARIAERFALVEKNWLGEAAEELLSAIEGLERRDVEIERKYLLRGLPEAARAAPAVELEQGYLPGDRLRERLRHEVDGAGDRFWRTVKLGTGVARTEIEEPTTSEIFQAMWPLTAGKRVHKRRYRLGRWEIDLFLDRDLVLAEIELASEDEPVDIPDWLSPYLEREVTGDPAYVNLNLAS